MGLLFSLLSAAGAQPIHVTTSTTSIHGSTWTISIETPTGSTASPRPTIVRATCGHDGYTYVLSTSVPPGQAVPPSVFTEVLDGWRWARPASVQDQGFAILSVHMASAAVGWGIEEGSTGSPPSVWRTTDGGSSWTDVSPSALGKRLLVGWTFPGSEAAWLAVLAPTPTSSTPVTVIRTADGGATWQTSSLTVPFAGTPGFPVSLSFAGAEQGWLLVHPHYTMNEEPGELFSTADGGATWNPVDRVTFSNGYVPHTTGEMDGLPVGGAIAFDSPGSGWLVGSYTSTTPAYLFHTTDGGAKWSTIALPAPAGSGSKLEMSVRQPPTIFAGTSFGYIAANAWGPGINGMLVYVTRDAGATWTLLHAPNATNQSVVTFLPDGHGWLWAPQPEPAGSTSLMGGALYSTSDGGTSWTAIPADPYLAGMLALGGNITRLDFATDEDGWALLQLPGESRGHLLRTTDGGRQWAPVGGPTSQ